MKWVFCLLSSAGFHRVFRLNSGPETSEILSYSRSPSTVTGMKPWRHLLPLFVIALAVCLRLSAWHEFRASALFPVVGGGHDRTLYHQAAITIAEGEILPDTALRFLPLYPWLLGGLYAAWGAHLTVAGWLGMGVDLATLWLLMVLARRCGATHATAAVAGLIYAAYPLAILYGMVTMPNTLNALMLILLVLSFRAASPFRPVAGLGVGLLAGLASLGFAGAIPMTLAGLVMVLFQEKRSALAGVAICLTALSAVLLPVALHNARIEGQWTGLTTHSGFNLYLGNHEKATGYPVRVLDFRMSASDLLEDAHTHAESMSGRHLSGAESSRWWRDQARAFWRNQPFSALVLTAKKFLLFWNHREVDDLRLVEQFRLLTGRFPAPPWPDFLPIGLLGLIGLFLLRRENRMRGMVLAGMLGLILFFITARYRLTFAPVLLAMGAAAVSQRMAARQYRSLAVCTALAALVAWLPFAIPSQGSVDAYNASLQLLQQNQLEAVEVLLTPALNADPDNPNLNHALGSLRFKQERFTEAAAAFQRCADREPNHPNARFNQGLSLARAGLLCEGLEALRAIPNPSEKEAGLLDALAQHCSGR